MLGGLENCLRSYEFWISLILVILVGCVLYYMYVHCTVSGFLGAHGPTIGGRRNKVANYSYVNKYTGELTNDVPAYMDKGCWFNMGIWN